MNIGLVHAGMVSALEVRFDFSERKLRHQALIPQNRLVRLQHLCSSWLVGALAYL